MIDWSLARRYQANGLGLGGVLLKQSLYPRATLLAALEGSEHVLDLGCGEGLLTHLLARALPRTRFTGMDLNAEKIRLAQACRTGTNTGFIAGDLFSASAGASAVIFNDVLHHLAAADQDRAFALARGCLDGSGVLVLKEVAATDALDKAHTSFWDHRLYPGDRLFFRPLPEWIALAGRHGFRLVSQSSMRHPWVASRSVLVFTQRPRLPVSPRRAEPPPGLPAARILLTGGTGFIGEWLLRELLATGFQGRPVQVGLVTRRPWALPNAFRDDPRVQLLAVDLAQPVAPGALGGPWDYVFHLAAEVDYFGGQATYRNNRDATAHLLAALQGSPVQRFVFASTMGALDRARFDDCRQPLDENSPAHPTSPYGHAKVAEENLVRQSGLPAVIIRIPWCYGPGMSRTHHVRRLLDGVRRNAFVFRWAWPGRVSLVSAPAAARSFIAAAGSDAAVGQTLFISDAQPVSFGELFAEMGRAVGRPSAGCGTLPRPVIWLARRLHFLLPFQVKALVCDALLVSDNRARALGLSDSARPAWYLDSLARFDAMESQPNRWRQRALVTGAASGIGRALARQLHARGHGLCLVDRDALPLAALATQLDAAYQVLDLRELDPLRAAEQLAGPHAGRVALVINNAGLGFRGGFAELEPAAMEATLAVNMRAVMLATAAFAREMRLGGGGTIVNIASTAAYQPLPYMAAYAASKAFVLSFTLAAGAEQSPGPAVHLLAVSPSGTRTNFQKSGGVKTDDHETLFTPEATAAAILHAAALARPSTILGGRGRAMALFARLAPTGVLLRTWEGMMRRGR
jgi:short-subunit dehydrogenase/SAM-dependent methyltransferase